MPDFPDLNLNPTEEIGGSGLEVWAGTVFEERLKQLVSARQRFFTFREMADNDPVIGSILYALDLVLRQVEWRIEEGTGARSTETAEFVDSCFLDLDLPWAEIVSDILSFIPMGFSWHEIVFKYRKGFQETDSDEATSDYEDGKLGWAKFASRAQTTLDRWEIGESGRILGMWQSAPPLYRPVFIPTVKSLHFRTTTRGQNPEGRSVLRNAYRPWYFKKTIEEIQAIGIERDLAGLPMFGVPMEYMQADRTAEQSIQRAQFEKVLRQVRRGTRDGVLYPLVYDAKGNQLIKFELMSTAGRRQFDTKAILEYYDQRIAITALADVILLGHEGVGSFALADSKTNFFGLAATTFLDIIADIMNRHAIPQLLRLNGFPVEEPPKLMHSDIETVDLEKLGGYIQALSSSGAELFPDEKLENHLRGQASLPGLDTDL